MKKVLDAVGTPEFTFLFEVVLEVKAAREKFPSPNFNTLALIEEVGELIQAILNGEHKGIIRKEAIQVAAMATRIALENDPAIDPYITGKANAHDPKP